jgi:hypothetical protein
LVKWSKRPQCHEDDVSRLVVIACEAVDRRRDWVLSEPREEACAPHFTAAQIRDVEPGNPVEPWERLLGCIVEATPRHQEGFGNHIWGQIRTDASKGKRQDVLVVGAKEIRKPLGIPWPPIRHT